MFTRLFTNSRLLVVALAILAAAPSFAGSWHHENGTLELDERPQRIVALNWAATEALLLLGVTPVGVADLAGYSYWVAEPSLPESGVHNVGTRVAPSLEAIAELKPDLIVTSAEMAPAADLLEQIAPTYVVSVYRKGSQPFNQALSMLTTLGQILDREERAQAVIDDIEQTLARLRARLANAGVTERPVALVNFLDDRHVRIYAPNGLFQTALDALGLTNAWPHDGNFWGFSVVGLEAIAPFPDARLVVLSPTPPGLSENLTDSPFWTHFPPVQRDQVYQVDAVWPFGGVFPVKRLALQITDSLLAGGSNLVQ
ncbi:iron-siderophore ABC transporter substrate-binding protein [Marinobacter sp. F4216]|uniref:iron-siderophore ABC transporter substrate-binding protein n=1 Tax=Marinobacter sp. F4216 TaxID=2874281 RepID=UPI001CBF5C31|nr:iron-siderophore ABC transporter substrate-binding protein [Marinobacter sp. F4216]MBZ2169455.1 iron-siderophore ABC transporter substrate-binding protein [Marinobacter sp. F4216]